jgi:hypothetical protein
MGCEYRCRAVEVSRLDGGDLRLKFHEQTAIKRSAGQPRPLNNRILSPSSPDSSQSAQACAAFLAW